MTKRGWKSLKEDKLTRISMKGRKIRTRQSEGMKCNPNIGNIEVEEEQQKEKRTRGNLKKVERKGRKVEK